MAEPARPPTRHRARFILMIAVSGLLGGCAPVAAAPAPAALTFAACPDTDDVQCATLTVPVDHDDPDGVTVDLAVARLPATDVEARRGVLVLSPGGPGPALPSLLDPRRRAELADLARFYDIVTFDPRGYGASGTLCDSSLAPASNFGDVTDPTVVAAEGVAVAAYAETCRAANPELAVRSGTVEHARDVEELRIALGAERIVFFGNSYGTAVGHEYAVRFGSRLARLYLDSVVDLGADPAADARRAGAVREAGLHQWAVDCTADPGCALHGQDPLAAWDAVVAAAQRNPLPTADGRVVTAQDIRMISGVLASPPIGRPAAEAVAAGLTGDGSGFAAFTRMFAPGGDHGRFTECSERPSMPGGHPALLAHAAALRAELPRVGWLAPLIEGMKCTGWPLRAVESPRPGPAPAAPPALVVTATLDSTTHLAGARLVAGDLPGSAVLPVDAMAHSLYLSGNRCVRDAVEQYLADGTLPPAGARCAD